MLPFGETVSRTAAGCVTCSSTVVTACRSHDIYGIDSGTFLVLRTRRVHTLKVKRMDVDVCMCMCMCACTRGCAVRAYI